MFNKYDLINALEVLNASDITRYLEDVARVMAKATVDPSWEHEITDEISVLWSKEYFILSYISEDEEVQIEIDYHDTYGVWFVPEYTLTLEEQFTTSLQEMLVSKESEKLVSYDYFINDKGRWEIPCGDEGWMSYVEELGCYTFGCYGSLSPFKELNFIEGLPNVRGKLVRNAEDDGYDIVKIED